MHCASCDFSDGSGASFQLHPTEVLNPAVLILFHETNSGFIFYWQCRFSVLSLKEYLQQKEILKYSISNEAEVGQAIKESGVKREDIFVVTKLWNADHGYEECLKAFNTSLKK